MDEINKETMNTEEPKVETPNENINAQQTTAQTTAQTTQPSGGAAIKEFDYQTYERVEEKATKTASTTALVLGICSIVFSFIFGIIGLALGIVGIVFAVKARKTEPQNGMATAGLICSIVGIVLSVLAAICFISIIVTAISEELHPSLYDFYDYY